MKTYTCDRCGVEHKSGAGIVGKEFDYRQAGFETLAPPFRVNGWVDLCGKCFEVVRAAARESRDEAERTQKRRFFSLLSK